METLVTIKGEYKGFSVVITQNQHNEVGGGHYRYVIYDKNGHILATSTTTGAVPKENISNVTIKTVVETSSLLRVKS